MLSTILLEVISTSFFDKTYIIYLIWNLILREQNKI